MKKIILLFAVCCTLSCFAQNFPGNSINLLDNKELKVLPLKEASQKYGYRDFYTDEELKKTYKGKLKSTEYDKLVNKVFKVVSYKPYTNVIGAGKYKLKIQNPETGILYFDYDPKYSFSFPFEVIGGLTYPEGHFCDLAVEKESANAEIRKYEFPYADGVQMGYFFKDGDLQFIILTINNPLGTKIPEDIIIRGITLTLENGKTIEIPDEKLKTSTNSVGTTVITAIFGFTAIENGKEIDLLKSNKLVKIKLGKYERNFDEGPTLLEYMKCAIK